MLRIVPFFTAKRTPGKTKEEAQLEKKQELEKRLEDVKGQLGNTAPQKKTPKKGTFSFSFFISWITLSASLFGKPLALD